MLESIFLSDAGQEKITAVTMLAAMATTLALGFLISVVYTKTHRTRMPSQGFALTLVFLPAVICVIILLIGNNVARAFSLAGAFQLIRFRSAPGEPKDITFVLFCMAVGLASGLGFLLYAALVSVILCAVLAVLEFFGYAKKQTPAMQLKIMVPEDLNFGRAFDDILNKYTHSFGMKRVKTADLGSVYELTYSIHAKEGINEKDFIDELRVRNGNMNISLLMEQPVGAAAEF